MYYYLNSFYLVFDLYPCIYTHFDQYPSRAHELSTVSIPSRRDRYSPKQLMNYLATPIIHSLLPGGKQNNALFILLIG